MSDTHADLMFCHQLAQAGYQPHSIMEGKEIISYPWPENGKVYINARTTPGDPTTMKTYRIILDRLLEVL